MTREAELADQQRQRHLAVVERQEQAERALAGIGGRYALIGFDYYFKRFDYTRVELRLFSQLVSTDLHC